MIDLGSAYSDFAKPLNSIGVAENDNDLESVKSDSILAEQIIERIDAEFLNLSDDGKEKVDYIDVLECYLPLLIDESTNAVFTKESLLKLITYASFLLSIGSYDLCVKLCGCILSSRNTHLISSVDRLKTFFLQAKAYRNSGQYPSSLKTLHLALDSIEADKKLMFMKGAALLRIGKVYSEYLMMTGVSIYFLQEAELELSGWLDHTDSMIREKVSTEYAICLDSIGQYWSRRKEYDEAISYFDRAEEINRSLKRHSGILRNKAHKTVTLMNQIYSVDPFNATAQTILLREMLGIVRALLNDSKNEKGAGVRYAQLAEMYFKAGREQDARFALSESRRIAHQYRDNKTLARAETIELKYFSGYDMGANLRETSALLKQLNYYYYQINVNDLAISAVEDGRLPGFEVIGFLQDNRAIYSKLSEIAKNTIITISDQKTQSEFSHLSIHDRFSLLREIIGDYDWFINKMNEIIDKLLTISKKRSDSLNTATISEAKASLASSVLHDFKHIIATSESGEISGTILDPVLDALCSGAEITPPIRKKLINSISDTNEKLKTKILPRINEATRVPRNFQELIDVRNVFLNISEQKPEEYQSINEEITVECNKAIQIEYNIGLFTTLFKELLRNAIDYQIKNQLVVKGFVLKAEEREIGIITLSVLTIFQDEREAENAYDSVRRQLSNSVEDYGYGFKMLYNFMLCKTRGSYSPTAVKEDCHTGTSRVGISFKVPISDYRNSALERK